MILHGNAAGLYERLKALYPAAPEPLSGLRVEMLPYQMIALYALARKWNVKKARILEIGTGQGNSAYMLSRAAPRAHIETLNANRDEAELARKNLEAAGCYNVIVIPRPSWDRWQVDQQSRWHMIFVDGDHNHVARDMVWWNSLVVGGLMLFHDYSPRNSPVVFGTLNAFRDRLGRPFDVELIDENLVGMAGFYRRDGESWSA